MINVTVNGQQAVYENPNSLAELLAATPDLPDTFAVAVNQVFIPKSNYASVKIAEGDLIELLVPMQGG